MKTESCSTTQRTDRGNRSTHDRNGFTLVELIVSTVVLAAVMSLMTTLCFRVDRIWTDIRHHRIAVTELSNQLESLTRMTPEEAQHALQTLTPSPECQAALYHPTLEGESIDDALGKRIVLKINWDRRHPGKPIELSGWLAFPESTSAENRPAPSTKQNRQNKRADQHESIEQPEKKEQP